MRYMKNKILFISDNFFPETNAPASRTYDHCLEWVENGYDVEVITCNPNFPKGKLFDGYKNKLIQKEVINGIKVTRVWSFIHPNKGFILRILDFISFAFMATIVSFFKRFDIVITTSPQFFTNFCGFFLSLLRGKFWCMEVRDIWPESIAAVGSLSSDSLIYKVLEWFEIKFYNRANLIVVVTNSFKEIILKKSKNKNISVVKNAVNSRVFNLESIKDTKSPFTTNKIVVGYIGTHGMAHNLEFILDAAKKIKDEDFHFVFIGHGANKEMLIKKAQEESISNCSFYDPIPKEQVAQHVAHLDIALVHLKSNSTFRTVIPSKIFEYAALHKPILNGVEGETAQIIKNSNIGLNYDPTNIDDFINNLQRLRDKNLKRENYLNFIESNNRAHAAKTLIELIHKEHNKFQA